MLYFYWASTGEDTTVPAQASSARTERATTLTEDAELAELQQW